MTPYLIGIAGPSCAGKSKLSGRLAGLLAAPIVSLDAYYRDLSHLPLEERARNNFDVPEALDSGLLADHLRLLLQSREAEIPIYDFIRHIRSAGVVRVQPAEFLIVEGLFILYWEEVRSLLKTKIFISVEDAVCCQRRLERDVRERGRTPQSVLEQYRQTVLPMAEQFILPTRRFADLELRGTDPLDHSAAAVLAHVDAVCQPPLPRLRELRAALGA